MKCTAKVKAFYYQGEGKDFLAPECGTEMEKIGDWPNPDLGVNMYNVLYQCPSCKSIKLD